MTSLGSQYESFMHGRLPALAAKTFLGLTTLVIAFQLALVAGAPWGRLTMGGVYSGQLPPAMRLVALVQALLLVFFAAVVAVRARLVHSPWFKVSRYLVWLVIAYAIIGSVLNGLTPSVWERIIWLPVVVALGTCAIIVARSP
jgi:hypothetical protein